MVEVTSFEMLQSIKKSINFAFRVIEEKRIHKLDKLPQEKFSFLLSLLKYFWRVCVFNTDWTYISVVFLEMLYRKSSVYLFSC